MKKRILNTVKTALAVVGFPGLAMGSEVTYKVRDPDGRSPALQAFKMGGGSVEQANAFRKARYTAIKSGSEHSADLTGFYTVDKAGNATIDFSKTFPVEGYPPKLQKGVHDRIVTRIVAALAEDEYADGDNFLKGIDYSDGTNKYDIPLVIQRANFAAISRDLHAVLEDAKAQKAARDQNPDAFDAEVAKVLFNCIIGHGKVFTAIGAHQRVAESLYKAGLYAVFEEALDKVS